MAKFDELQQAHQRLLDRMDEVTDKATFVRVPTLDEVPYPVKMEPNLVAEFYSR